MAEKKEKQYVSDNARLMAEWNWEKNNESGLYPHVLTCGGGKKVWWKCEKGHEWQAMVSNRNKGRGCPYCSGRYAIKGYNDLATLNPRLTKEWNYEKNESLKPDNFTAGSGKKIWWKCEKGHEWQATIVNRNKGSGCPVCKSERNTSFPEYAIVYYLQKYGLDVIQSYKKLGYELDIYIPSKKVAIEYDGYFWHKDKRKKDLEKNVRCKSDGIKLYRIREDLSSLNDYSIDYIVDKNQKDLAKVIQKVLSDMLETNVDVDIKRDSIEIENLREYTEKEISLFFSSPILVTEWNYEKNGKLRPENFTANSDKKVWWRCNKGHEWKAIISNRNKGIGCPICSNKAVLQGYNDIPTHNPKLANEWNYEKNGDWKPQNFTSSSGKKVWWKCKKGHEWQATIASRTSGTGCPICVNKTILIGYNDLLTINPKLANEWDFEKNVGLKPENFTVNSGQKVWWKCKKGHGWQATIHNRNNGRSCPICTSKKVLIGYNDLGTVNSGLVKEWNYEKNGDLKPENFTVNSGRKVWWKCNKGHEWHATIANRNKGRSCPYCAGQKIIKDENDLLTINPKLASEWNCEKNNGLTSMEVMPNSNKKVWWKCAKGHEWQAVISSRNNGSGCPYCAGRYAVKGETDLVTLSPKLACEWNYEKNGKLRPENFTVGSHENVWWKCQKGHEWQARIYSRNSGRGCPQCAKQKQSKNKNKD